MQSFDMKMCFDPNYGKGRLPVAELFRPIWSAHLKSQVDLKGVVPKLAVWHCVRNGCTHCIDIHDKKLVFNGKIWIFQGVLG
jgi:hypothetical protein